MLNQEFENKLKAYLEEGRSEWDREALWTDIEEGLPKKRRRWAIWFLLPLVLGVAAVFLFGDYNPFDSTETEPTRNMISLNGDTETEAQKTTNNDAIYKSDEDEATLKSEAIIVDQNNPRDTPGFGFETQNIDGAESGKRALDNQAPRFVVNELPVSNTTGSSILSNDQKVESADIIDERFRISMLEKIVPLKSSVVLLERQADVLQLSLLPDYPVEVRDHKNPRSYFTLGGTFAIANKSLDLMDQSSSEYFKARQQNEEVLESFGASVGYGRFFGKKISLSGILNYEVINEKFEYQKTMSDEFDTWKDDAYSFVTASGATMYQAGKVMGRQTVNSRHLRYNSISSLNLIIMAGYHFNTKPFTVSVRTGPVLNLHRNFNGEMYNLDFEVESFDNQGKKLRTFFNAWDTQIALDKSLSSRWSLSLGLNYRLGLNRFSLDAITDQKYDQWGLQSMVVYKF